MPVSSFGEEIAQHSLYEDWYYIVVQHFLFNNKVSGFLETVFQFGVHSKMESDWGHDHSKWKFTQRKNTQIKL